MAILEVKNIKKSFGKNEILKSISFSLEKGEVLAVIGSSGGGTILLTKANEVLKEEFPELYKKVELHIPDEKARRVGQSVAAASLPKIG